MIVVESSTYTFLSKQHLTLHYNNISSAWSWRDKSSISRLNEFPSNLTPSQRRLLMMTLGKDMQLQTPWETPSSRRNNRNKRRKTPILRMQIDIAGTPSLLTVHEGDDITLIAQQFVAKHQLPSSSVNTIRSVIGNAVKEEKKRTRKEVRRWQKLTLTQVPKKIFCTSKSVQVHLHVKWTNMHTCT